MLRKSILIFNVGASTKQEHPEFYFPVVLGVNFVLFFLPLDIFADFLS